VTVLSSPRISTLNNVKAVIKVGSDKYFVGNISGETVPTTSTTASHYSNINLQSYFSGVSLDVTPQISANGIVTLHIHPTISRVGKSEINVISDGKATNIPTADTTVRESDSVVQAKSGQVIIIGGLMQTYATGASSALPGLDSNGLTRGISNVLGPHKSSNVRSELVILLRPVVINTGSWAKELEHTAQNGFGGGSCEGPGCSDTYYPDTKT
jgi:MSHA biogenesis protein MshL